MDTITYDQAELIIQLLNNIFSFLVNDRTIEVFVETTKYLFIIANVALAFLIWEASKALYRLFRMLIH